MKTTNKKILQTQKALRNALCILLETESIHNITVSQICRVANINRTTFYKYYGVPIDILSEYIEELCEQTLSRVTGISDVTLETDLYSKMVYFCNFYYENQHLMRIYMECTKDIQTILQKTMGFDSTNYYGGNHANCFISGGVMATLLRWGSGGYKQAPEDIAKILTNYIIAVTTTDVS